MCVLNFPLDFFRLTRDAWQMTLEGFPHRFIYRQKEQPCPFCRDLDAGITPRVMSHKIRYWNLWMIRLLMPELTVMENPKGLRNLPICHLEGGYTPNRSYYPLLAIGCLLTWTTLIVWGLWVTGWIPEEVPREALAWLRGNS